MQRWLQEWREKISVPVFALGIGYFHFRHGLPLAPRSLLYPLFGEKIHGWIGHITDAVCVVGTLLGVLLVVIFFITSSDSGSFVDDMVTCGGHPAPPAANRVFCGVSEVAAAASLLLAGGLPRSILLILACVSMYPALRAETASRN